MLLFFTFVVASAATSISIGNVPPTKCSGNMPTVNLTSAGWNLPLTSYDDHQDCVYNFHVPTGFFAYVDLKAYQLRYSEQAVIRDTFLVDVGNDRWQHGVHSFSNAQAWIRDFYIELNTGEGTGAQLTFNITLLPATPTANIVKSYVTYTGSSSVFVFSNTWNEGESYKFTSKSGAIYAAVATQAGTSAYDANNWNNIFVYENGVFMNTLAYAALATRKVPYISNANEVIFYCAKKVVLTGAAMITDYSNVHNVAFGIQYVPSVPGPFPAQLQGDTIASAVTLVSARENPTNVTIQMIYSTDGNGSFSYNGGGPLQKNPNAISLTDRDMPKKITGFANTFYLSSGDGIYGFDVRPSK